MTFCFPLYLSSVQQTFKVVRTSRCLNMSLVYRILLILCFYAVLFEEVRGTCSLNAADFLENTYNSIVEEMRRGVPRSLATALFAHIQSYILELEQQSGSTTLADTCISSTIESTLIDVDKSPIALKKIMKDVKNVTGGKNPSYKPRNSFPASSLAPLTENAQNTLNNVWAFTSELLNTGEQITYDTDLGIFPNSWDLVDDSNKQEACSEFEKYSSEDSLTAKNLTTQMIALVVRMRLNGVPEDEAIQMLYHHAAYTFDGMRCRRTEDDELYIPLAFSGIYQKAAALVSKGHAVSYGPVAVEIIEEVYPELIQSIAAYNSWGAQGTFSFMNEAIEYRSWKSVLFDNANLERVRNTFAYVSDKNYNMTAKLNSWVRNPELCTPGWTWEDSTRLSATGIERCCSELCYDGALAQSVLSFSIESCCEFCNQAYCDGNHEDFDDYVAIVPEFGEMASTSTPIVL